MNNQLKQHLKDLLTTYGVVAILGDDLYYEVEGEPTKDYISGWDQYFDEIVSDTDFKTEIENMHLIITLNT